MSTDAHFIVKQINWKVLAETKESANYYWYKKGVWQGSKKVNQGEDNLKHEWIWIYCFSYSKLQLFR